MKPGILKHCLLLLVLSALGQLAMAQVTIKGIVKDNKNSPVAGASISIKDSYDGTTADSNGHYSFKTTENGSQVLVVSSIGYKTVEQPVKLEGSSITLDIGSGKK